VVCSVWCAVYCVCVCVITVWRVLSVCVRVWCVVCGLWCVVCGVWRVVSGVWCGVCVWCVVCGMWCVVCRSVDTSSVSATYCRLPVNDIDVLSENDVFVVVG